MGKTGGASTTPAKRKKGRPSITDLKKRSQDSQQNHRRSTRRNPNSTPTPADDNSIDDDDYYDDDDDERKQKKVKLVVRLPQLDQQSDVVRSESVNSGSDSNADADTRVINSGSGPNLTPNQEKKVAKAMDIIQGSPLKAGPTTPLPDKKLIEFILDRFQKKDTHAVFSEPVDPDELPDYYEIIEKPMDFSTLRSKLDKGLYSNLEDLEADVYLICSNAMLYNPSDTVFFRQARAIQELAKRDFQNLKEPVTDGQIQPKVVRRGRPPGKHPKKPPGRTPPEVVAPESTSAATVANTLDNTNESTPYNLRRGPAMYKNYADSSLPSHRSQHSELLADWNEEFPARIKRADMKYGNKHFNIDETRRDTYKQFHPLNYAQNNSLLTNFGGERKQLLAVGLHAEHGYSRSLARFAANMGPIVWKTASMKIKKALPPGVSFAPGVVGEPDSTPLTSFFPPGSDNYTPKLPVDNNLNKPETPSTSGPKVEDCEVKTNKLPTNHVKNGLNGVLGSNFSKMGMFQAHGHQPSHTTSDTQGTKGETGHPAKPSWQQVSSASNHKQFTGPVSADLNVGIQGPSAGSPQQPDLALQL